MIKAKKLAFYGSRRKPKGEKVIPPEFQGKLQLDENKEWVRKEIPKRISYPQDWPSYNLAQSQEKLLFYKILNDAVDFLEIEEKFAYRGRPRVPMRDVVKSAVVKIFCGFSLRRTVSELKMIKGLGYINQIPSYNCLADAFQNPEVGTHLADLYQLLALPLKGIEKSFSVDSTGFSTTLKTDWVSEKFGVENRKGRWKWKKLHAICGNKSNVIASVRITEGRSGDSPYFQELVGDTAKTFKIGEVCADPAYISKDNVNFVVGVGGVPFLKPRSNVRLASRGRGKGPNWIRMLRMWKDNETEFRKHYHLRSNIESTFSSVKRKFGGNMRTKKDISQQNELLAKIVCHNGSVLVNSIFELGVEASWN